MATSEDLTRSPWTGTLAYVLALSAYVRRRLRPVSLLCLQSLGARACRLRTSSLSTVVQIHGHCWRCFLRRNLVESWCPVAGIAPTQAPRHRVTLRRSSQPERRCARKCTRGCKLATGHSLWCFRRAAQAGRTVTGSVQLRVQPASFRLPLPAPLAVSLTVSHWCCQWQWFLIFKVELRSCQCPAGAAGGGGHCTGGPCRPAVLLLLLLQ